MKAQMQELKMKLREMEEREGEARGVKQIEKQIKQNQNLREYNKEVNWKGLIVNECK